MNILLTFLIELPRTYLHGLPETITTSLYLMLKCEYFQNSFYPFTVNNWNKLNNNIWNLEVVSAFEKQILKFFRPSPNSMFNVHNPHGIKLHTRLWVGLSHLCKHKFVNNFQGSLDPFCDCGWHIETIIHFFLHRSNYSNKRKTLFKKISNIKCSLLNQNNWIIVETFLFGLNGLNDKENALIIESTIKYIIIMERFVASLLWVHLSKSPPFLKSLFDSGPSYFIPFSCLVVQNFYIFIFFIFLCLAKRFSSRFNQHQEPTATTDNGKSMQWTNTISLNLSQVNVKVLIITLNVCRGWLQY